MAYKGMMDGWNGDENECHGHCGLCDNCEERYYQRCDDEYESWRDDQKAA